MTDAKLKELKGLAEKATPGEWRFDHGEAEGYYGSEPYSTVYVGEIDIVTNPRIEDGRFIAAANPQTVLALIAEIESHRRLMCDMVKYLDDHLCQQHTPTIVRNTIEQHLRLTEAHKCP